ncbi:hypothetical protein CALCODRAFT_484687 [Calocera cornea HHB12733]|uniref:Uncharacterized protein n=1 Tax=Calocera cornea HHB12733 TaxID=1353952 RepID=A0A165ETP6_9BASI|nr:hypothetical protein CALCODRAFT_484687 [Calocera cornea HHB12733]
MAGDDDDDDDNLLSSPSSVDTERGVPIVPSPDPYAALLATFVASLRIIHSLSDSLHSYGGDLYDNGSEADHSALLTAAELAAYALLDLSGDAEALADVPSLDILEPVDDAERDYPPDDAEGQHHLVQAFVTAAPRIRDIRLDVRAALRALDGQVLSQAEDEEFHEVAVEVRAESRELAYEIAGYSDQVAALVHDTTSGSESEEANGLDTIPEEEEEWEADRDVALAGAERTPLEVIVDEHADADDEDDGSSDGDTIETPLRRSRRSLPPARAGQATSDEDKRAAATQTPGLTDQSGTDSSLRSLPPYMAAHAPSDADADADADLDPNPEPSKRRLSSPTSPAKRPSLPSPRSSASTALLSLRGQRDLSAPAQTQPGALAYMIAVTFQLWVLVADMPGPGTVLARPWSLLKAPSRRREGPE